MSRTWKRYAIDYFRRPRGHVQARRAGLKSTKVPPDSYQDLQAGRHCYAPTRVARKMEKQGITKDEAILKLKRKFRLSHAEALEVIRRGYKNYE